MQKPIWQKKSKLFLTFDLTQHVHGPTHNRGHTLDLLISKGSLIY